jgi:hypothetical protein
MITERNRPAATIEIEVTEEMVKEGVEILRLHKFDAFALNEDEAVSMIYRAMYEAASQDSINRP